MPKSSTAIATSRAAIACSACPDRGRVQHHPLGDLHDQPARLHREIRDAGAHDVDEARVGQLRGRHVDVHREPTGRAAPGRGVGAGPAQHQLADVDDRAGALCGRHELRGMQQPPGRVKPPHQGLDGHAPAVLHRHDGLVVHHELIGGGRRCELGLEHGPPVLPQQAGIEHLHPVLALGLRRVHGDVGALHELLAADITGSGEGQAHARTHLRQPPAQRHRRRDALDEALPDEDGVGGGVGQQHRELVTPEPRAQVIGPDTGPQPGGHGAQQLIARGMAQVVVHDLEVVQVQEQQRDVPGPRRRGRPPARR